MIPSNSEPQFSNPQISSADVVSAMRYCGFSYSMMHCELDAMISDANQQRYVRLTIEDHGTTPDYDRTYVDYIPVSEEELEALSSSADKINDLVKLSKGRRCVCIEAQGSHYYTCGFFNPYF